MMDSERRNYFCIKSTESFMKKGMASHDYTFRSRDRFKSTSLSKVIWELKDSKNIIQNKFENILSC